MATAVTRTAGRPRDPALDRAIMAAAEQQLRELGYAGMSLESVAAAADTTVPTVRRRFSGKAALAAAVIGSLRIAGLPAQGGAPRAAAPGAAPGRAGRRCRGRRATAVRRPGGAREHAHRLLLRPLPGRLRHP